MVLLVARARAYMRMRAHAPLHTHLTYGKGVYIGASVKFVNGCCNELTVQFDDYE